MSSIKVNGFLSKFISILRSVKQGCPLSALLFIICVEILALAIKNDDDNKCIAVKTKDKTHKNIIIIPICR